MKTNLLRLVLSVLISAAVLNSGREVRAQTAFGEIQDRPSPVFRCPGLPCAVPNVFNITVAIQYNASAADLTAIQNMITAMSAVLFDVTDGQAQIGEAFIYNNAFGAAADIIINPATAPTWWQASTGNYKVGGSIMVSINNVLAAGAPGESLAHEFVHLVFDARDEYESRAAGCGGVTGGATCPIAAAIAAGQTRCLMDGGGNGVSSELCWGLANPADPLDFSGGNHEAALITEHSRCRGNRSCWEQVVWSWPDYFTMPAAAPDPAAGGAVVGPTSFVIANSTVRAVLVLDESGSMSLESPTRMARLKVAANDFVTLAENGTEVGVVSFSTDAEAASGHANVAIGALNAAQRAACTAAINALNPNGWTGIGLGLEKARAMIMAAGGVTANTYIVLMTDGLNNRPLPDWDAHLDGVVANLVADGIPVLVTCTGGDVGLASQCSEIATATGGFSVDSADAADLQQAFVDFHEKISGREHINSVSAKFGDVSAQKIFVEKDTESVTFTVVWRDPNATGDLVVIDPLGNRHVSAPMPQGRYTRLRSPLSGDYQMVVNGQAPSNTTYVARAYVRQQINSLRAALRHPSVLPGQPIYLYAYPRSGGGSLTDPTDILGTVRRPDGSTDIIRLHDRGPGPNVHGDDADQDGIFTGVYFNTGLKGPYQFLLKANISNWVNSTDGEIQGPPLKSPPFTREVRLSAAVDDPRDVAKLRVSINEWMANNTRTLTNPFTRLTDSWFELYNPNSVAVNLSGWLLANESNNSLYVIPSGYTIPAGAYRVVWADGLGQSDPPELHVNFRLNPNGDTIILMTPEGRVCERVAVNKQPSDVSEGHSPNGGPYIFVFSPTQTTPGKANPSMQTPPLRIRPSLAGDKAVITFNTAPGLVYRVEYRNRLDAGSWTQLAAAQVATGSSLSVIDPISGRKQRFYRVVIVQ